MDIQQKQFITKAVQQAQQAGHIFPVMAACEAALESGYGTSGLAIRGNNLFGTKQHSHPIFGTLSIPTREFLHEQWVVVNAEWVSYPDQAACFTDRMATLRRLAPSYPHYAAALAVTTPQAYIVQVSMTWATDPGRAGKVLSIYGKYNTDA
jgi:flagellum-specific peptidoglycan hydrolase FlgJ